MKDQLRPLLQLYHSSILLPNPASQTSVVLKRLFNKFPAHKSLAQSQLPRPYLTKGSLLTYSKIGLKPREEKLH